MKSRSFPLNSEEEPFKTLAEVKKKLEDCPAPVSTIFEMPDKQVKFEAILNERKEIRIIFLSPPHMKIKVGGEEITIENGREEEASLRQFIENIKAEVETIPAKLIEKQRHVILETLKELLPPEIYISQDYAIEARQAHPGTLQGLDEAIKFMRYCIGNEEIYPPDSERRKFLTIYLEELENIKQDIPAEYLGQTTELTYRILYDVYYQEHLEKLHKRMTPIQEKIYKETYMANKKEAANIADYMLSTKTNWGIILGGLALVVLGVALLACTAALLAGIWGGAVPLAAALGHLGLHTSADAITDALVPTSLLGGIAALAISPIVTLVGGTLGISSTIIGTHGLYTEYKKPKLKETTKGFLEKRKQFLDKPPPSAKGGEEKKDDKSPRRR